MERIKSIVNKTIPGSKGKPICLDIFYKEDKNNLPLVIFVHGFKGFKDWGHFNDIARIFSESGFVFLKFNFSHNGTTPEYPDDFIDLEAFGNNNYIIEMDDLGLVIDWALGSEVLERKIDKQKIFLVGHSRGGGICILKAKEDTRIKKLVTWAAVSDLIDRNKQSTINGWKENGVVYAFNSRTKQNMPLYYQLYESSQLNRDRLNILNNSAGVSIPSLIIHGTRDEAVSVMDAAELHKAIPGSKLLLIEGAGHTFEAAHPYTDTKMPENANRVLNSTIAFLIQEN